MNDFHPSLFYTTSVRELLEFRANNHIRRGILTRLLQRSCMRHERLGTQMRRLRVH